MPSERVAAVALAIPGSWARVDTTFFFSPTAREGFHANISVATRPALGAGLKAAARGARADLVQQGMPDLRFLGESELLVSDWPAICIDFQHGVSETIDGKELKADLRRRMIVVVAHDRIYEIGAAARRESTEDWREIDAALEQLRIV